MSAVLFNKKLTTAFQPTLGVMIAGGEITLYFDILVAGGTVSLAWYLEFTDDPIAKKAPAPAPVWRRELAEEDSQSGVVLMPEVVRTFADNGGTTLSIGVHNLDAEFKRRNQFCRVQLKATGAGTATVKVSAPFGQVV